MSTTGHKRPLGASAPSCRTLATELLSLEDDLEWDSCRAAWDYQRPKWVQSLLAIEKDAGDEAAVVKQLAQLASNLQMALKPTAVSTWLSGSTAKAWRARLATATDTAALDEAVSGLALAMNKEPNVPAWLAASASPPAPVPAALGVKVEPSAPATSPAPATRAPPTDTAAVAPVVAKLELPASASATTFEEASANATTFEEVADDVAMEDAAEAVDAVPVAGERHRRFSIGTEPVAQRQQPRIKREAGSSKDEATNGADKPSPPAEEPSASHDLPPIAPPPSVPAQETTVTAPVVTTTEPSSQPPSASSAPQPPQPPLPSAPASSVASAQAPAVLSASWLLATADDDARAEVASDSSAEATVTSGGDAQLAATSAAMTQQIKEAAIAKETMGLREVSRDKEAAAMLKKFLEAAPVGTVGDDVKGRVHDTELKPGECANCALPASQRRAGLGLPPLVSSLPHHQPVSTGPPTGVFPRPHLYHPKMSPVLSAH